jgi:hypothetical protein
MTEPGVQVIPAVLRVLITVPVTRNGLLTS